jgi:hypothetical protein
MTNVAFIPCQFVYGKHQKAGGVRGVQCGRPESLHCEFPASEHHLCEKNSVHGHPYHRSSKVKPTRKRRTR